MRGLVVIRGGHAEWIHTAAGPMHTERYVAGVSVPHPSHKPWDTTRYWTTRAITKTYGELVNIESSLVGKWRVFE